MASSNVSNKCVANNECKKNALIKCDGCSSRFCSDHFPVHRRELEARLELVCSQRDQLHHEFIQKSKDPTELLNQIDRWEQQTLADVKQTANNARQRIRELATTKSANRELDQFSEELRRRKENEDFFEEDIERLAQQLEQIKIQSKQLTKINISYTPIVWDTMIQINSNEQQQQRLQKLSPAAFLDTSLLTIEHQQTLNQFCEKPNQQWELVYRGTRDGFGDGDFLRLCADRGPTMTLIQANACLFGGYISVSWKNTDKIMWYIDPTAFLFTLTNPHRIPPTKYPIKSSGAKAIRPILHFGTTFGHYDICIYLNSDKNDQSFSGFPKNYCDTTGMGCKTFTGTAHFQTSEIEVFRQV